MADRNGTKLSNFALTKARDYILNTIALADSSISIGRGSAVRSLLVLPSSLIYAGVMDDIEGLRVMHLGNFDQISESDMDLLATSYFTTRSEGTFAATNIRVYINDPGDLEGAPASRELKRFGYFRNPKTGVSYMPISPKTYGPEDAFTDEDGIYINVSVEANTLGIAGRSRSGDITDWSQVPFTVLKVTNPEDTTGGEERDNNEEFYSSIQMSLNDGALTQRSGFRSFIEGTFINGSVSQVVDTGHPMMMRDEIWVDENGIPNVERRGIPYANHVNIGEIRFDLWSGRALVTDATLDLESFVGKRIAIPDDPEFFRTILSASNTNRSIMVSGNDLYGVYQDVYVWNEGMHIGNMADIYMHSPLLEIETVTKSNFVQAFFETTFGETSFSFLLPVSESLQTISNDEYYSIVINPGQDDSISLIGGFSLSTLNQVVDYPDNTNNVRHTVTFSSGAERLFGGESLPSLGDNVFIFANSKISVSEDGDIAGTPVIHVLDIRAVDPVSGETLVDDNGDNIGDIPQTKPGNYDPPGWYFRNTDPANLLSTSEDKLIIIDEKIDSPAFYPHNENGYAKTSRVRGVPNSIHIPVSDLSGCEGRSLTITVQNSPLQTALVNEFTSNQSVFVGTNDPVSPTILNISGLNPEDFIEYYIGLFKYDYDSNDPPFVIEGQPLRIAQYQSPATLLGEIDVVGRGDKLYSDIYGNNDFFHPDVNYIKIIKTGNPTTFQLLMRSVPNQWSIPEVVYENSVVMKVQGSVAEVLIGYDSLGQENKLIVKHNDLVLDDDPLFEGYNLSSNINVKFNDERGNWTANNIQVVYATSTSVRETQSVITNDQNRNLCTNTIVRSVFPSLIDTSFKYSGSRSPSQMQASFVSLIREALTQTGDDENSVKIDMSNIISRLDDEGLSDFLETNFEIRVTDHLSDGEYRVRYMNPSLSTRQAMSLSPYAFVTDPLDPDYGKPLLGTPTPVGVDRVTVKKLFQSNAGSFPIPSRGKIYMGGSNEELNEIIPYEAVIAKGEDEFILIFRGGFTTQNLHYPNETVIVTKRDYDPSLEMVGHLTIPSINRPYVRQAVAVKVQDTSKMSIVNPYDPFFKGFK